MPVEYFLTVGSTLFVLGVVGFLTRRNLILIMLSGELMLHGVSINFVAFSRHFGHFEGQAFTAFVLTVAACEAGLGLSIILLLYRRTRSLDVRLWSSLSEEDPVEDDLMPPVDISAGSHDLPHLAPAGRAPQSSQAEVASRV